VAGPAPAPLVTTRLRPARPEEAGVLGAWRDDPQSPYEDFTGPAAPGTERAGRVAPPPGGGELVVADAGDRLLGSVSWHPVLYGPSAGSTAFDIGISLRPQARGRGHGWRAQRLLADHLFLTTPVHRVQATTDVGNEPEQRALARAGFVREGVVRGAQWRQGAHHDLVLYSRLRTDD
jgi:RimJ/RimL family protein N-acetyltransferase